jgi:glycerophosphoryl diester phosphodiesterase
MSRILFLILGFMMMATPVLAQISSSPVVIAHRGASGERPEHTRAAFERAIEQGADMIEPDLVLSKDGHLIVRHENEIGGTTDVADRPEYAERRRSQIIDGHRFEGWFTEDFTLFELRGLLARERLAELRPANTVFADQRILTFQDVIDIARDASILTGRTVGVAPELKHPTHFASLGLDMEAALLKVLRANGLTGSDAPVIIQCFEVGPLQRLNRIIDTPLLQLMAANESPADRPDLIWGPQVSPEDLADISAYADYIGVESGLVLPRNAAGYTTSPTTLVRDAHAQGLKVVVWTLRAENAFLPMERRIGDKPADHGDMVGYVGAFVELGVDAVFTDFPGMLSD